MLLLLFVVTSVNGIGVDRRRSVGVRGGASKDGSSPPVDILLDEAVEMAQELKMRADSAQRSGDLMRARELYLEALVAAAADPLVAVSCQLNLARCCSKMGDDEDAIGCCDEALRALDGGEDSRSLRAAALYRRGIARDALGMTQEAAEDASQALSLGESRALPLLRKLRPQPPVMETSHQSSRSSSLGSMFADPQRIAGLVPMAKAFATPDALEAFGLEPERARSLASTIAKLEPDTVEVWLRRGKTAFDVWKRLVRIANTAAYVAPILLYALFFAFMLKGMIFAPSTS